MVERLGWDEAVRRAKAHGHRLKDDPPANGLSRLGRATCEVCGRAVLGTYSSAYGSAAEVACEGKWAT